MMCLQPKVQSLKPSAASRSDAHRALEQVALHQQHKGMVVRFNADKGFGFISIAPALKLTLGLGLENDLYVNVAQVRAELQRGQKVLFRVGRNKHGWQAVNVEVV